MSLSTIICEIKINGVSITCDDYPFLAFFLFGCCHIFVLYCFDFLIRGLPVALACLELTKETRLALIS